MEALINSIIRATGWSIFHSLWQGALLYALLLIVFLMVPKHSARLKHNLAYVTITLMFAGFCTTFFSIFKWPPLTSVSESLHLNKIVPPADTAQTERYFPILVSIYVAGLLLQLVILSSGYYKTWKLKRSDKVPVPDEWKKLFSNMVKNLHIKRPVDFYLSRHVNVPLVLGFFKPVILFPVAFATQLDMVHVEAILIHELGHIRRNDYSLNILKTVMETILFFNPFTWLCSTHIQREREHACDDLVLKHTHTPLTYAHALLQIELLKEKRVPVFSLAASGNNQDLYQRIKRITAMKTSYNTAKQQIFAVTITILTLLSIAWISPTKAVPAAKKMALATTVETIVYTEMSDPQQDTIKKNKPKVITKGNKAKHKTPVTPLPPPPPAPPGVRIPMPPAPPAPPAELAQREKDIEERYNSKQWQASAAEMEKLGEAMARKVESPEWKKKIAEMEKAGEEMARKTASPEFKRKIAEIEKHGMAMARKFESPEWKNHIADLEKRSLEISKSVNTPEFRKKMEDLKNLHQSPEFKRLRSEIQKDVEAIRSKHEQERQKNN